MGYAKNELMGLELLATAVREHPGGLAELNQVKTLLAKSALLIPSSILNPISKSDAIACSSFTTIQSGEFLISQTPYHPAGNKVLAYFEVKVISAAIGDTTNTVSIGYTTSGASSWAGLVYHYQSGNGEIYCNADKGDSVAKLNNGFGTDTIVGCGLNYKGDMFFTENGHLTGLMFWSSDPTDYHACVQNKGTAKSEIIFKQELWKFDFCYNEEYLKLEELQKKAAEDQKKSC